MGNYCKFGPEVQEMSFKRFFYFQIRWPFCSAEQNYFSNSGRGQYGEHSCKIILNLDQCFKRRCHYCQKHTNETQWTKTYHNSSSLAFGSGELIMLLFLNLETNFNPL